MAKVVIRQKAIDDLNDIWDYTFEKWSERQANTYYATIQLACKEIGEYPELGKQYAGTPYPQPFWSSTLDFELELFKLHFYINV